MSGVPQEARCESKQSITLIQISWAVEVWCQGRLPSILAQVHPATKALNISKVGSWVIICDARVKFLQKY